MTDDSEPYFFYLKETTEVNLEKAWKTNPKCMPWNLLDDCRVMRIAFRRTSVNHTTKPKQWITDGSYEISSLTTKKTTNLQDKKQKKKKSTLLSVLHDVQDQRGPEVALLLLISLLQAVG